MDSAVHRSPKPYRCMSTALVRVVVISSWMVLAASLNREMAPTADMIIKASMKAYSEPVTARESRRNRRVAQALPRTVRRSHLLNIMPLPLMGAEPIPAIGDIRNGIGEGQICARISAEVRKVDLDSMKLSLKIGFHSPRANTPLAKTRLKLVKSGLRPSTYAATWGNVECRGSTEQLEEGLFHANDTFNIWI